MSENRKSEGKLVTLENATAASNISAGRFAAVLTGANTIYSLDKETTGLISTANVGMHCVGILDDTISGGQSPVVVWTEGVFQVQLATSITTAAFVGMPVYPCTSGGGSLVTTSGTTGDYPLGTVVGCSAGGGTSGQYVQVLITPGAKRWGSFGLGSAHVTGTGPTEFGNIWPPIV